VRSEYSIIDSQHTNFRLDHAEFFARQNSSSTAHRYEREKDIINLTKNNNVMETIALKKHGRTFSFVKTHQNLSAVLLDHKLASLGDAYVNFVFSLALSKKRGEPSGAKVKGNVLAEALKKAGLREHMPSRMTRHMFADAAEALIVYTWLHNYITLDESVATLEKIDDPIEGFSQLLATVKSRIKSF
jgi:hypothetical protein